MSAACARARERFSLYGEDRLDPEERRDVREHLRACRACAEEATASDPSLLFAALPAEEVSAEEVDRVVSAVRTGVALRRAEKKLARSPRRIAAIGSAAAVVALTLLLPGLPETPDRRSAAADLPAASVPASSAPFLPGAAPASTGERFPEDATIYDWNPGSSRNEPRVVWIVDRSLDI